ncbi:unnamed protein product [Rhizoctonia solani]|uniref:Uncharacterized protein n=1 Tax=Rhizoctonia solani TaxID=456999 RepID=A0A8H3GXS3_9AGAM|nr:unnamed protein product [Rhizoctonia solani]
MKVSGIISALIFAQVALGQAADSSTSVTGTSSVSGAKAAASATGSKSQSSSASSTAPDATPTGPTSAPGTITESHTLSELLTPEGVSEQCSTFLKKLNSDTKAAGCLASLNTALSSFTSGQGSASDVPSTLKAFCSSTACSTANIPSLLAEFSDACSSDFASNKIVATQYDVWYTLTPYKTALCVKDGDEFCLLKAAKGSSSSQNTRRSNAAYAAGHLANPVTKRDQTVLTSNIDTFRKSHLLYQFASTDIDAESLCTNCTQIVTAEYVKYRTANAYALAASQESLFGGGVPEFWASLSAKCPVGFPEKITELAGVDQVGGAATHTASYLTALVATFATMFTLF